MKLFLASTTKHPDSVAKLRNFIGVGLANKKIVYVPTARNGEFYGSWKDSESLKIASSLGADLAIVELENYFYQDIFAPIEKADILWVAGGMSGYLLYWFRRTGLDKRIAEILNNGTIYVGSSAGSMVCSRTQRVSEWYLGGSEPGASLFPGLGLVDFEIYPHFADNQLEEIKKHWQDGELRLLKDGEVITVVDGKVEVLGEPRVLQ